jgi:hypothetical protein
MQLPALKEFCKVRNIKTTKSNKAAIVSRVLVYCGITATQEPMAMVETDVPVDDANAIDAGQDSDNEDGASHADDEEVLDPRLEPDDAGAVDSTSLANAIANNDDDEYLSDIDYEPPDTTTTTTTTTSTTRTTSTTLTVGPGEPSAKQRSGSEGRGKIQVLHMILMRMMMNNEHLFAVCVSLTYF